jgi:hypothetical protein
MPLAEQRFEPGQDDLEIEFEGIQSLGAKEFPNGPRHGWKALEVGESAGFVDGATDTGLLFAARGRCGSNDQPDGPASISGRKSGLDEDAESLLGNAEPLQAQGAAQVRAEGRA